MWNRWPAGSAASAASPRNRRISSSSERHSPMPAPVPPGVIGHNRSLVTRNYAVLPPDGMFPSFLPWLRDASVFYQTTPKMGASFAQGRLETAPGGGTTAPRQDGLEHFLYMLDGTLGVAADDASATLGRGGFPYTPAGAPGSRRNPGAKPPRAVWTPRPYAAAEGIAPPLPRFGSRETTPITRVDES